MTGHSDVLRIGTEDDFTLVRQCLRQSEFSPHGFMMRFGVSTSYDGFEHIHRNDLGNDALSVIVKLFVLGDSVKKKSLFDAGVTAEVCSALERLDLVRTFAYAPSHYTGTVKLQPVGELVLASDRFLRIGATNLAEPADHVLSPLDGATLQYMRFLPDKRCRSFLELCAGSGVAALHAASRFADHAWACDVSERACDFIEFNRRLNHIGNVSALVGDLFDPLAGNEFDCIVAHPPYIPALNNPVLYRAGGEIGDEILTRILNALPDYLMPGGFFYGRAVVPARESMSFEERIRESLGENSQDFDVLILTVAETPAVEYCRNRYSDSEACLQLAIYKRNDVNRLLRCVFLLHRRTGNRRVFTAHYRPDGRRKLQELFDKHAGMSVTYSSAAIVPSN